MKKTLWYKLIQDRLIPHKKFFRAGVSLASLVSLLSVGGLNAMAASSTIPPISSITVNETSSTNNTFSVDTGKDFVLATDTGGYIKYESATKTMTIYKTDLGRLASTKVEYRQGPHYFWSSWGDAWSAKLYGVLGYQYYAPGISNWCIPAIYDNTLDEWEGDYVEVNHFVNGNRVPINLELPPAQKKYGHYNPVHLGRCGRFSEGTAYCAVSDMCSHLCYDHNSNYAYFNNDKLNIVRVHPTAVHATSVTTYLESDIMYYRDAYSNFPDDSCLPKMLPENILKNNDTLPGVRVAIRNYSEYGDFVIFMYEEVLKKTGTQTITYHPIEYLTSELSYPVEKIIFDHCTTSSVTPINNITWITGKEYEVINCDVGTMELLQGKGATIKGMLPGGTKHQIECSSGTLTVSDSALASPILRSQANTLTNCKIFGDSTISSGVTKLDTVTSKGGLTLNDQVSPTTIDNSSFQGTIKGNSLQHLTINKGAYTGSPAINLNDAEVIKATITDLNNTTSSFVIGPDSISESTTSGNKTVTTVRLENPPIIIDWSEFPQVDQAANLMKAGASMFVLHYSVDKFYFNKPFGSPLNSVYPVRKLVTSFPRLAHALIALVHLNLFPLAPLSPVLREFYTLPIISVEPIPLPSPNPVHSYQATGPPPTQAKKEGFPTTGNPPLP